MNIVKPNLRWKQQPETQPLNLANIDGIAIHHMDHSTANIYEVHQWHLQNGWIGIGYNYWVAKNGTIYEGRGLNLAAGVLNNNGHLISIGFQGDYDNTDKVMPNVQFEAGIEIIKYVLSKCPNVKEIDGHRNWNNTTCPGQYFPLITMINKVKDSIKTPDNKPIRVPIGLYKLGSQGNGVKLLQQRLNQWYGYELLQADGVFGEETEKAVKTAQIVMGVDADGVAGRITINGLNK